MDTSQPKNGRNDVCEDCGVGVPEGKAGCQRLFEEVLAREFSDYRYGRRHRLTVDAYSLQHPDRYMNSGKSFAAHLTGMCAALEHEGSPTINRAVQVWLNGARLLDKPPRIPGYRGGLTIMHVHGAANAEEHLERVLEWARSVWGAWSEHHGLARRWIDEAESKQQ